MAVEAAAEAGQAEDPVVRADAPGADSCAGAKCAPSVSKKLPTSITKRSIRFGGLFQNGPRLNPAAVPASAPNTSAPFGLLSSGPGRSRWCHLWPTMPTQAASAAERARPATSYVFHPAAQASRHAADRLPISTPVRSRLDNGISLAPKVRRCK